MQKLTDTPNPLLGRAICYCLLIGAGSLATWQSFSQTANPPPQVESQSSTAIDLGTEPVNSSGLNSDGSTTASGGMIVPLQTFGPFGETSIQDNPFSMTAITEELIRDQQARTLTEAARNDPSYGSYLTSSSSGYSNFFIRGVPTDVPTNNRIDGLPVTTQSGILLQDYERIDIYKGLSALEYGFTGAGGLVNYVSKLPLSQPLSEISVSYLNSSEFFGAADLSRRFGADGAFGLRLNLGGGHGTGPVNEMNNDNYLAALAFDWRIVPNTKLWVNASYSKDGHYGLQPTVNLAGQPPPSAPDASRFFGVPFTQHVGTTRGFEGGSESELTSWLSARVTLGDFLATRDVAGAAALLSDDTGDFRLALTPHNRWSLHDRSGEFAVSPHIDFGFVSSKTDFVVTGNDEKTTVTRLSGVSFLPGMSNLYDPSSYENPFQAQMPGTPNDTWNEYRNYAARETLGLGEYVSLFGAIAHSKVQTSDNSSTADFVHQEASTPSGGIVVKPVAPLSVYASYTEGLQPGSQAGADFGTGTVVNAGASLPPFVAKQYEVGAKYEIAPGLQTNAALFKITQPSAVYVPVDAAATTYVFTTNGEQVNKGIEWSALGKVASDLTIFGGVTFLDATIAHSQDGTLDGKRAFGIPKFQGNMFAEYALPVVPGLSVMTGAYYTSMKYVDSENSQTIGGFATFDLGFKYSTDALNWPTTLRFYAQNLTNKNYWTANVYGPVLTLGDPRTFRVDLSIKF